MPGRGVASLPFYRYGNWCKPVKSLAIGHSGKAKYKRRLQSWEWLAPKSFSLGLNLASSLSLLISLYFCLPFWKELGIFFSLAFSLGNIYLTLLEEINESSQYCSLKDIICLIRTWIFRNVRKWIRFGWKKGFQITFCLINIASINSKK